MPVWSNIIYSESFATGVFVLYMFVVTMITLLNDIYQQAGWTVKLWCLLVFLLQWINDYKSVKIFVWFFAVFTSICSNSHQTSTSTPLGYITIWSNKGQFDDVQFHLYMNLSQKCSYSTFSSSKQVILNSPQNSLPLDGHGYLQWKA